MNSQNIFIFIYDVEFELLNIIKHIRQNNKDLDVNEFIEEFTMNVGDYYDVDKYKKYLTLAKVKFYIDNKYFKRNFTQDDFLFVHLNQMFNIYSADKDDFDCYSLISDPDSLTRKYHTNINRNFFLQFNEYQSNNTDDLFDNIPHFNEMSSKQYKQIVN